jgi:hypothetical protein
MRFTSLLARCTRVAAAAAPALLVPALASLEAEAVARSAAVRKVVLNMVIGLVGLFGNK